MTAKLVTFNDAPDAIADYMRGGGLSAGLSTGWSNLDELIKVQPGMLSIVTGIPSSGKSEWLDQLMLNTIALHGWHWTVFSPENWPLPYHFQKLAEKWTGKPMFDNYSLPPMDSTDLAIATDELSQHICFVDPPQDDMTVAPILKAIIAAKEKYNTNAFILDPYNELEHNRPSSMSESEYIGQFLTKVRNIGRKLEVAIFIVAHPVKMVKNEDGLFPVCDPYSVSGSANWRNKCDAFFSVWRDYQKNDGVIQVHIQKVRNKNMGNLGMCELHWCRPNGLFLESPTIPSEYERYAVKWRQR